MVGIGHFEVGALKIWGRGPVQPHRAEGDTRSDFERLDDFQMGPLYPEIATLRRLVFNWTDVLGFPNMQDSYVLTLQQVQPYPWEE